MEFFLVIGIEVETSEVLRLEHSFMLNTLYRLCIQFVTRPAIVGLIAAMTVKYLFKNKQYEIFVSKYL